MAKTEIAAEASLDTTKFQRGLAKADKGVKGFAKNALKSFGALAGVAGLGAMARSAIDLGSKISDLAVQLNIGTTELQTLEFAAREAGVEVSIMERALRNVQLRTQEAINGNKSYSAAFDRLGINVEKFNQLPTEQKLEAVAKAQSNATDKAAAYNDVAIILGQRAGPAMQEVLQNLAGPDGYKGLEDAAKSSGEVMSKETIAKMDAAADKIESFKRKMTVMAGEILSKAMPAFKLLRDGMGFVGEMFGTALSNQFAFFTFLSKSLIDVIEPAVKQFKSLGKAIEASMLAAKGEFGAAKAAIDESMDEWKESFGALVSIPDDISDNFKELQGDVGRNMSSLGDDLEKRAESIGKSWADMASGMVKDSENASEKIETLATGAMPSGKGGTTSAAAAKGGPMGLNIERGEFEGRKAFLKRREEARRAHLRLNEAKRQIAAGSESFDVNALQQLKLTAMGGPQNDHNHKMEKMTSDMKHSLKTIEREMSQ